MAPLARAHHCFEQFIPPDTPPVSRIRALLTLGALILLLIWGLLPASRTPPAEPPPPGKGDSVLYMKVIDRLATGEGYYEALGDELRGDNYPTSSPFNWRTPFHLTMVAWATVPAARLLLKILTLLAVLATAAVLAASGRAFAVVGTLAQMGALATAFRPQAVGVAEVWAGVFVALSACAYCRRWWAAGALLGVSALFVRELAAPYCLACGLLALGARRREAGIWIVAGLAYAAYYGLHISEVYAHQAAGDLTHTQPWQQWNGVRFTLATIEVNGWLSFVPGWATVVYMVLALGGAASRTMAPEIKWALLTYFGLFAVVGLPFNYYWGFITAPLWAFGLAHAADGFRRLISASAARSDRPEDPASAGTHL